MIFYLFSKLMKVIMEIFDLLSQIVFLIRIDDDIKMLHAKFQPSMTIFRIKAACTQFGKFTPFSIYYCQKRSLHQMCSFFSSSPVNCGSKNIKINKSMKFWNNGEIECFLVQCAWPLIFQQNYYYLFFCYLGLGKVKTLSGPSAAAGMG